MFQLFLFYLGFAVCVYNFPAMFREVFMNDPNAVGMKPWVVALNTIGSLLMIQYFVF